MPEPESPKPGLSGSYPPVNYIKQSFGNPNEISGEADHSKQYLNLFHCRSCNFGWSCTNTSQRNAGSPHIDTGQQLSRRARKEGARTARLTMKKSGNMGQTKPDVFSPHRRPYCVRSAPCISAAILGLASISTIVGRSSMYRSSVVIETSMSRTGMSSSRYRSSSVPMR